MYHGVYIYNLLFVQLEPPHRIIIDNPVGQTNSFKNQSVDGYLHRGAISGWDGSPGGVRRRTTYGANKSVFKRMKLFYASTD